MSLIDRLSPIKTNRRRNKTFFKATFITLTLFFIIIALSGPKFGYKMQEANRRGVDIVFAVDVSKSMLANDVKPNRLQRSKRKIEDLLKKLEGDRIGLVAFAGISYLQCPLTLDYSAFKIFLDYLDPSLIPIQGTSISNALEKSLSAFGEKNNNRNKAIILISDGEEHEEGLDDLLKKIKEKNISIFTMGVGSNDGSPIKLSNGFLKDKSGNVIISKLKSNLLKKIATETGGTYTNSVSNDDDINQIYFNGIKNRLEDNQYSSSKTRKLADKFQIFIFISILFLILDLLNDIF